MSTEIQLSVKRIGSTLEALPWEMPEFYAAWLSQTYYFTSHSTRLLEFSGFYTGDPASKARYKEHIEEEKGHERIALADLQSLGADIAHYGEQLSTRAFYWRQYELIRKCGDRPFLGYVLMLELLARDHGPVLFDKASSAHGARCTNFLKVHVEEDIDHVESAIRLLEGFSSEERDAVVDNFNWSVDAYRKILEDCVAFPENRLSIMS